MKKKVVVIGSGPGGYYTAIRLASAGVEVTLVEKKYIGGTCLNVGCIPSKALLDYISLYEHFKDLAFKKNLFHTGEVTLRPENLRLFQAEIIKQLQTGLEKLFKKRQINFVFGEAVIVSKSKIKVNHKATLKEYETDDIVIATGSKPRTIPGFEFDGRQVVSSDDIWNIPHLPESILIIGSGPIGIEYARIFNALGSSVTLAEIQDRICPILDLELSENLVRSLKRRGVTLKVDFATKFVEKKSDKVLVEFISTKENKREKAEFEQVLVAVGRKPDINNLGLENAGIELEQNTFIKVNEHLETNVKNIWAIGDVTNYPQLAHTASFQARVVACNILGYKKAFKGDLIPSCIFGYPEIAFVGEREESLKEKEVDYKAGKFLFLASGKAKASGHTEGFVKVLMDNKTKMLLGAHIIGPEASNLIHELVVAMQNDLTVNKIVESVHAHPTYSEVVLEALEDCLGEAVHV